MLHAFGTSNINLSGRQATHRLHTLRQRQNIIGTAYQPHGLHHDRVVCGAYSLRDLQAKRTLVPARRVWPPHSYICSYVAIEDCDSRQHAFRILHDVLSPARASCAGHPAKRKACARGLTRTSGLRARADAMPAMAVTATRRADTARIPWRTGSRIMYRAGARPRTRPLQHRCCSPPGAAGSRRGSRRAAAEEARPPRCAAGGAAARASTGGGAGGRGREPGSVARFPALGGTLERCLERERGRERGITTTQGCFRCCPDILVSVSARCLCGHWPRLGGPISSGWLAGIDVLYSALLCSALLYSTLLYSSAALWWSGMPWQHLKQACEAGQVCYCDRCWEGVCTVHRSSHTGLMQVLIPPSSQP